MLKGSSDLPIAWTTMPLSNSTEVTTPHGVAKVYYYVKVSVTTVAGTDDHFIACSIPFTTVFKRLRVSDLNTSYPEMNKDD